MKKLKYIVFVAPLLLGGCMATISPDGVQTSYVIPSNEVLVVSHRPMVRPIHVAHRPAVHHRHGAPPPALRPARPAKPVFHPNGFGPQGRPFH